MASFVYYTAEYDRYPCWHRAHLALFDGEAKVQFVTLHKDADGGQWQSSSWHGGWEAWGRRWVRVRAHYNGAEERAKVLWFRADELVLHVWHLPCIEDNPGAAGWELVFHAQ